VDRPILQELVPIPGVWERIVAVEARLDEVTRSDDEFLTELAQHLLQAGGKRYRPLVAQVAAELGPNRGNGPVEAGVSVELVHLGSLYHDDVMDDADIRHGVESVNHRWGNLKAILAGDFLLARASEIAASLGTEIAELLAATIARLCEGQVAELQRIYDPTRTEDAYFAAIAGKTAALYSTSCRIGALVAGSTRDDVERLTEFGHLYGVAYQIVDDVLDVVATEEQLGKPSGNDMREGVYTLPVIRLLRDDPDGPLAAILGGRLDDDQREEARRLVLDSRYIADSIDTALGYTDAAVDRLEPMNGSVAVEGLRAAAKNLMATLPD
jgi:heptaprenyl diphosphate synthase